MKKYFLQRKRNIPFLTKCLIALYTILFFNSLDAQVRFGGGVVAGFNASQMDGDNAAGFNKVGGTIGLRATMQPSDVSKWLWTLDMLFSQRGSRSSQNDAGPIRSATLNYLEVPLLVNYRDWKVTDKSGNEFYKVYFTAGLSYGRLFSYKISDNFTHPKAVWDVFEKNDVAYTGGLSYFVNRHWGFNWRYTRSANFLFHPKNHKDQIALSTYPALQVYFLTFQTVWMF
ncbi:MAG: outer membrane beta-barrel protein [Saprospiraceae bacterium]|nr:outer membrane beta-barrel protein [Saprospiraceae bacterium]